MLNIKRKKNKTAKGEKSLVTLLNQVLSSEEINLLADFKSKVRSPEVEAEAKLFAALYVISKSLNLT